MRTNETETSFSIIFSNYELWFLMQLFSPGVIFGIENPYSQLSSREIEEQEKKVRLDLVKDNIIKPSNSNQLMIDELIGGLIYSSIHSNEMIIITDNKNKKEYYLHFLPSWQLEMALDGECCFLTIFKERENLWSHFSKNMINETFDVERQISFSLDERDLELASYLYQEGNRDKAISILKDKNNNEIDVDWDKFISNYLSPKLHFTFNTILNRDDINNSKQIIQELIQLDQELFWVTRRRKTEINSYFKDFSTIQTKEIEIRMSGLLETLE